MKPQPRRTCAPTKHCTYLAGVFLLAAMLAGSISCSSLHSTQRGFVKCTNLPHELIEPPFGDLRYNKDNGVERFQRLLGVVDRYELQSEECDRFLKKRLEAWPDTERIMPGAWIDRILDGEEIEAAKYVRGVSIADRDWTVKELRDFLAHPSMREILEDAVVFDASRNWRLRSEGARLLANSRILQNIRVLDVDQCQIGDEGLAFLAQSPYLRLKRLNLRQNSLTPTGFETVAQSGAVFSGLVWLDLSRNALPLFSIHHTFNEPDFPQLAHLGLDSIRIMRLGDITRVFNADSLNDLKSLSLDGVYLRDRHLEVLLNTSAVSNLDNLSIARNFLSSEALLLLAESPFLGELNALDISRNNVNEENIQVMMTAEVFKELVALNLSYNQIGDDGLEILSNVNGLSRLRRLNLRGTGVGSRSLSKFASSEVAGRLEWLDLGHNGFGNGGATWMSEGSWLASLRYLDLAYNDLGDDAVAALMGAMDGDLRLETLNLRGNEISDEGALQLGTTPLLGSLKVLNIRANELTIFGAKILMDEQYLPQLECLDLRENSLREKEISALRDLATERDYPRMLFIEIKRSTILGYCR